MGLVVKALAVTAVICFSSAPSLADDRTVVAVPMFEELLAIPLPANFVVVEETRGDGTLIWEAYPEGQSPGGWSERISILAGSTPEDPSALASKFSATTYEACPDTFAETAFGSRDVAGAEDSYGYWTACGTLNGSSTPVMQENLLIAVRGKGSYVVTWTTRGPAMDEGPDSDDDILEPKLDAMYVGLKVCPMVAGEAAPYASCTAD